MELVHELNDAKMKKKAVSLVFSGTYEGFNSRGGPFFGQEREDKNDKNDSFSPQNYQN